MNKVKLSRNEWGEIQGLSYAIANASSLEDNLTNDTLTKELLYKLDRLKLKYGALPILLSTRADYIENINERLKLYKQAFYGALETIDKQCVTQSAESIAELYVDEMRDYNNGNIWLKKLRYVTEKYGDQWVIGNLNDLQANLNRLEIKVLL